MLGLNPVAMVIFGGVPEVEPVAAAGLATVVGARVAAGVPLCGVALDEVVVSVDGNVADVDEPHAATMMLTQSNTAIATDLRIISPLRLRVLSAVRDALAAEYHRYRQPGVTESGA
ncbi:MAG TPA: hypothetical protein VNE17_12765 [Nitrolancea sp.]|nr:hypothetical protein [Nitrolancea sp.]